MRRYPRLDTNHRALADFARSVGCSVQSLASIGKGCPDLLLGQRGVNYLVEVKDPSRPPSERKLTPLEALWHPLWRGQVAVVETQEDLLRLLGLDKSG